MGGSLNAYTSHDLVAFHITVRAEAAMEAIDLLTDFVGRPKIDPAELDKERGVVIQEIQRYKDQPAAVAEELIDRAHFGDHPLGRTVLGPEDHLRTFSRDAIVAFRERRWSGARGGAFVVGNVDHVPANGKVDELFARFPDLPEPEAYVPAPAFEPRTLVEQRDTNQSHLRMSYRPQVAVDDPKARAAFTIYATLLGGSMGSRLFDEIREQRGLCYSVYATDHAYADVPVLQLGSGLESTKCAEAYTRMREIVGELAADGPDAARRSSGRAPTPPAGASWPSRTPTRSRATRPTSGSSSTRTSTPTPPSPCSTRSPSTRSSRRPAPSTPTSSRWPASARTRAASSHPVKPAGWAASGSVRMLSCRWPRPSTSVSCPGTSRA